MSTDTRIPLKQNTELCFTNRQKGQMVYVARQEIGRGGSCIVYSGYYISNTGSQKPVRIKECYPRGLCLHRRESGELVADGADAAAYEKAQERMRTAFEAGDELSKTGGLTNSVSNFVDFYEANHTCYMVSSYLEGETLSPELCKSLKDAVAIVKSAADAVRRIHDKGYLYLDIKPENLFVLKDITEMVVLFDFDSLVPWKETAELEKSRIFYTKGFAAPELKTGKLEHIGKHTDVYGIGALLYYLVFGRIPQAPDCDTDVIYDYGSWRYAGFHYQDRLYHMLTAFFHHTLAAYYGDRYADLGQVVAKLDGIEKMTDVSKPFIRDSYIPEKVFLVGREAEEERLCRWMADPEKKCLFVTGMGGIGKSTLVRSCILKNRAIFDTVLYLYYNGSIQDMIIDDSQLCVNTLEKMKEESREDYFRRKLLCLRKLAADSNILLVIDNFDGKIEEDFLEALQVGWKLAAITRNDMKGASREYGILNIGEIQDPEELQKLVAFHLGRQIREDEKMWVELLTEGLCRHTLILELLAKQMARSCLTAQETFELAKKQGFASLAPEKVDYVKDGKLYYGELSRVITALFSAEKMPGEKRALLRMLSLFDMPGIETADFQEMLELPQKDFLYELQEEGWIQLAGGYLSLHPVIRETVRHWEWAGEYRVSGLKVLRYLFKKLDMGEGMGIPYLRLSENVLNSLRREGVLRDTEEYDGLLCRAIMKMPRDREDFIMERSEELFQKAVPQEKRSGETMGNAGGDRENRRESREAGKQNCRIAEEVLKVCDYVSFLYCEKGEFESAWEKIMMAERLAARQNDAYIWGLYYAMEGQYYEARLNGAYLAWSGEERRLLRRILQAGNNAVRHMKRSAHPDVEQYLARYLISEANLLIRSKPGRKRTIRRLMQEARRRLEKPAPEALEIYQAYYLALAWFHTCCEPDYKRMSQALQKAYETAGKKGGSRLDLIDFILIPAADILSQWELYELSMEGLEAALELCGEYPDSVPYIRKKMDLYGYMLDIRFEEGDLEQCRRIITVIDEENEKNSWAGIVKEVPEIIREAIAYVPG